jgi:hypothetical protein
MLKNDFYTFIVTSTIDTPHGVFSVEERYNQTLDTFKSIRKHVPNAKIVFIDNSSTPLFSRISNPECYSEKFRIEMEELVDLWCPVLPNLFTIYSNGINSKGLGELYMMYEAVKLIEENKLIGKRIFKLSGRYKLTDTFDLTEYDNYVGKYTFKINPWDMSNDNWVTKETVIYFETRLWSFCRSQFNDVKYLLPHILHYMLTVDHNYEKTLHAILPHENVIELTEAHVEGHTADTGVYKYE